MWGRRESSAYPDATFVQSGGLDLEKAANVFFNARTSGFPGFDVRWSFGGGSTTDGLGDITLSAENFFFSTDVDFRFLVGDSNNWGTSFTPAGDGWWTNLDTTQTLMVDGNATFGGDIRFASDGTSDVGTTSVRAGDGYSDTWNSEVVRITNTGHTSHYALTWDSVYFNVARTDGVVSFRLTNADHKALFKGAVAAEADLHLLTDDGLDQWIWTTNVSDHLELKEVGWAGVVLTFDAFANKLNIGSSYLLVTQAISVAAKDIDCQGAAGCNLGGPWGDIDMRGFLEIESPNAQLGFKAESALGGGDANTGAWQVYNSAGLVRMHSWVNGDNSGLYLYNDASNLTAGLTTFGTLGGADSAYFFLKDGSNRTKIQMGVDSGGDPQLLLTEAGAGTDVVITLQNLFNGGDFAVADNEGRNKANVSIDGDGAPFFNLIEPGAGVSNGVVAKVIASGVTQGGNIVISDLNGTQRGYFGTLDNGASDTVSVNSAGVDVPLRSTSSTTTTGLLFDAVNVIERKAGTFSGACTTGTLGLNSSGGAGTSLYVCESSAWVGK